MLMSDDPIDILNRKGAFLQKFCVREIAETGWRVEEEFPVTLTVHKGESSEVIESVGDIKAREPPIDSETNYRLTAVVECKHRFNTKWVFLDYEKSYLHTPKLLDLQYYPIEDLSRKASMKETAYYYASLNLEHLRSSPFCNMGREIPECLERKNREFDSIYAACREVVLATKSSSEAEHQELDTLGNWQPDWFGNHNIYIPMIVTSAETYLCKYDLSGFEESKVVKNGSIAKVDWVAYDFPLPSYLQTRYKSLDEMDYQTMRKQTIFIVNFRKCKEFLNTISDYFEERSEEILREPHG
jgi:hypothetical protein